MPGSTQAVDALARQQLAARRCGGHRLVAAAALDAGEPLAQLGHEREIRLAVGVERGGPRSFSEDGHRRPLASGIRAVSSGPDRRARDGRRGRVLRARAGRDPPRGVRAARRARRRPPGGRARRRPASGPARSSTSGAAAGSWPVAWRTLATTSSAWTSPRPCSRSRGARRRPRASCMAACSTLICRPDRRRHGHGRGAQLRRRPAGRRRRLRRARGADRDLARAGRRPPVRRLRPRPVRPRPAAGPVPRSTGLVGRCARDRGRRRPHPCDRDVPAPRRRPLRAHG